MDQISTLSHTDAQNAVSTSTDLVTGPWNLSDLVAGKIGAPKNGKTVFSCFHCGGGSTMGYKLAGFDVLGGVEIDPEMMAIYRKNHNPRHSYLMGVQDFKKILDKDLPSELFNLDVLDGSPPCSSFSMAGSREDAWGKEKKFREGQTEQVLDDLFFDFIAIAKKLQPKVVISENVKGLISGNARGYVKMIFEQFNEAGYDTQLFLLNASRMGVPQARERVFFISRRKDLNFPSIKLEFNEAVIPFSEIDEGQINSDKLSDTVKYWWSICKEGQAISMIHPKQSYFNSKKVSRSKPLFTITSAGAKMLMHYKYPRSLSDNEIIRAQSFPRDYNFLNQKPAYVCGMSVPPLMMQRVANSVYAQLLSK